VAATEAWQLLVCVNERFGANSPSCGARGGERLVAALARELAARGLTLPVERIYCFGYCTEGPNVRLAPGGPFFHQVDEAGVATLLDDIAAYLADRTEN